MLVEFMFPYLSIWAAPRIPMTRSPVIRFCIVAKASRSPPLEAAAYMTRGSATAMGISSRAESMAPVSKKMMLSGAFMCLAAMAATMEMPVPQKTMSPFRISRAAMIAMSSLSV